jgi:hypothetical protein
LPRQSSALSKKIRSSGPERHTNNTPHPQPTKLNSHIVLLRPMSRPSGKLELLPNASFLHGSRDRLAHRGWDHSPTCPLSRQNMETTHHLLANCRYTHRIWNTIANWIGIPDLQPATWSSSATPLEWRVIISSRQNISCKASHSIVFPSIGKFGKREIVELQTYIVPYTYTCN